jgi:AcrR family transcriptional regulator
VNANSGFYNLTVKSGIYRISDLEWVRPVRQERSQRTLQRLLDAAEAVIREKGFGEAAVAEIAARAGCSVGTFYRRFRDKQALLHALDERFAAEFRATMQRAVAEERWAGARIAEILGGYLEFSLEEGITRASLHRATLAMAARDQAFSERQLGLARELHERLRELLLARRDEIGHPQPEVAVEFVLEQLRAMLLARLDLRAVGPQLSTFSDNQFIGEALASACAYLQLPAPPTAPHDGPDGVPGTDGES